MTEIQRALKQFKPPFVVEIVAGSAIIYDADGKPMLAENRYAPCPEFVHAVAKSLNEAVSHSQGKKRRTKKEDKND